MATVTFDRLVPISYFRYGRESMVSRWVRTTHQSTIFVYRPITCIKLARSLLALTRAYFRQQSRDGYLLLVLAHYLWQRQLVSSALMHLWTHRFAQQFTISFFLCSRQFGLHGSLRFYFVQQTVEFARQSKISLLSSRQLLSMSGRTAMCVFTSIHF